MKYELLYTAASTFGEVMTQEELDLHRQLADAHRKIAELADENARLRTMQPVAFVPLPAMLLPPLPSVVPECYPGWNPQMTHGAFKYPLATYGAKTTRIPVQ